MTVVSIICQDLLLHSYTVLAVGADIMRGYLEVVVPIVYGFRVVAGSILQEVVKRSGLRRVAESGELRRPIWEVPKNGSVLVS